MRLSELNPRGLIDKDGRSGMGLTFRCPACKQQRLSIWYANPMDGKPAREAQAITDDMSEETKKLIGCYNNRWQRTGEDFETLTLSPSVDASAAGHWHGFIENGSIKGEHGPCASPK